MNTSKIKSYAIQARRDFIKAVTERANFYGIFNDNHIEELKFKGDVAISGDRAISKKEGELRERLVDRVKKDGFELTMQAAAYTWFNRFVALRYMELHNYLEHGFRVLSHPSGSDMPEILEHVVDVNLQGLNKNKVIELKLAGNKDNELYRLLIIAQCNALNSSMPFLFDKIDSETELLLPENLLHSDSPIRKLVTQIDEADWQNVEIIGWIYQFYISERKDEVIGKVVKSEDIPAATQLFTPNWIVKYMVQNTLGRMWLATYPDSPLRSKMEYYIEPAQQEPEVQKQLDAITPKELNPEAITFLDPASGSGHILVEAYDIFKEIYLERGYRTRDIPKLILEKNLYGLDICERAAQLAGFAVLMRARADDRKTLSDNHLKLSIMSIQSSAHLNAPDLAKKILKDKQEYTIELINLFEHAKTFGSLITIPEHIAEQIEAISEIVEEKLKDGDMFEKDAARQLLPIVKQAVILAKKYGCVVTNPPYMGANYMNPKLKDWGIRYFPDEKSDLFAMFIAHVFNSTFDGGFVALMTPFTWMNLTSYSNFRAKLLIEYSLRSLIKPEYHSFFDSAYVPICSFVIQKIKSPFNAAFIDLSRFYGEGNQAPNAMLAIQNHYCDWRFERDTKDFLRVPSSVIAYSLSQQALKCFNSCEPLLKHADLRQGLITGDNERFLRFWHETDVSKSSLIAPISDAKWFPYQKGGAYRKWYGNNEYFVNWDNSGSEICSFKNEKGKLRSRPQNIQYYFREGLTWTSLTISPLSMRYVEGGFIFDAKGPMCFPINIKKMEHILGYTNSKVINIFLKELAPTMDYSQGPVGRVPFITELPGINKSSIKDMLAIAKSDWDSLETSYGFQFFSWVSSSLKNKAISKSMKNWRENCISTVNSMQRLEEENNRIFIEAYGLQDELTPDVPLSEITLTCNPHYRYGRDKTIEELENLLLTDTIKELISYAIGCMMGRYSLDEHGLIYAHSGNIGFDSSRYKTFPADEDGIIPIMDMPWFLDDVANRFVEFIKVAWSKETLDENLKFIADALNSKRGEDPIETIRRYLSTSFFKDHLKTYKKRPIYWLFSSGKQKAFECLVYLHRYNESTLSRMRSLYVTPLQGNIRARIEYLQNEKDAASSASDQRKFQKEIDMLKKKQAELSKFDDELRHYADMRISLDLDDGVKVNYGKFGNLLAEVKAITGE